MCVEMRLSQLPLYKFVIADDYFTLVYIYIYHKYICVPRQQVFVYKVYYYYYLHIYIAPIY